MAKKSKSHKLHSQENSQNQESSQKSLIDPQKEHPNGHTSKTAEPEPDNTQIPFPQFRKSFNIFNKTYRSEQFKSYAKFKSDVISFLSQAAFNYFKHKFTQVSGLSFDDHQDSTVKYDKVPSMFQQNIFVCEIPQNTTFFIHIYKAHNDKFHIIVMNSTGYVYAYFVEMRSCSKFPKLYKILKKINTPQRKNLCIIYDQIGCAQNQHNFLVKIADFADQFCYYYYVDGDSFIDPNEKKSYYKSSKGSYQNQDNLFCFYSPVFNQNDQTPYEKIKIMIKIQNQIENSSEFPLDSFESSVDFIMKNIFINYQKFYKTHSKNQMYGQFKKMIDNFGSTIQKKKEIVYGNPEDHYPQKMESCKQCVHCPFNKARINKSLLEMQKNTAESFFYESENFQFQQKEKTSKKKSQKDFKNESKNKREQKNRINFKFSDDEDDINVKTHKSKYRCEGCSATAKKDIALCIQCFPDYHIKKDKIKAKNLKKYARVALKKPEASKNQQNLKKNERNQQDMQKQGPNNEDNQSNVLEKQNCKICAQDSTNGCMSEESNMTYDTVLFSDELVQSKKFNQLLEAINIKRNDFINEFRKLYSDPETRNMALTMVEFVQLKMTELTFWENQQTKR